MENSSAWVHICMVCDRQYVMPVCVALQSMADSQRESRYQVHLLTKELTAEEEFLLKSFDCECLQINILTDDSIDIYRKRSFLSCVSERLPEVDKVLYLDADIVVKQDLAELYDRKIDAYYAAAVRGCTSLGWKKNRVKKIKDDFQEGVLLLNLKKIREEKAQLRYNRKIKELPVKYNYMPAQIYQFNEKWKIEEFNEYYACDYSSKKDAYMDAAIIHYASGDKPWENPDGACASDWVSAYLKAPVDHNMVKIEPFQDAYGISVIIPCYNVENYIAETMDSILGQTFQNFEIICVDDGSTDRTLDILRSYEREYENIRVIANSNHGPGYERNVGIMASRGTYLYYMDSDDLLHPDCFARVYRCAQENRLDLVYFEGSSFYETPDLEEEYANYKKAYTRTETFPEVYRGLELFVKMRKYNEFYVSPVMQLARRGFIQMNGLCFEEISMSEDVLYSLRAILSAQRVKCMPDMLYYRRIRKGSIVTSIRRRAEIRSLNCIIREIMLETVKYKEYPTVYRTLQAYVQILYRRMGAAIEQEIEEKQFAKGFDAWHDDLSREELAYGLSSIYINNLKEEIKRLEQELRLLKKKL